MWKCDGPMQVVTVWEGEARYTGRWMKGGV